MIRLQSWKKLYSLTKATLHPLHFRSEAISIASRIRRIAADFAPPWYSKVSRVLDVTTCAGKRIMFFRLARHATHHTAAFILAGKFIPSPWVIHDRDKTAIRSRALKVSQFSQESDLIWLQDGYLEHFEMETFSFELVNFSWTQEKSNFNIRIMRRALRTFDYRANIIIASLGSDAPSSIWFPAQVFAHS